jgi:hypothetical protein
MKRYLALLIIFIVLMLGVLGWLYFFAIHPWTAPTIGELFLQHLLAHQESEALAYVTEDLQRLSMNSCSHGKLTECASELIDSTWGNFSEIHFVIGSEGHNSMLYHVYFENISTPGSIVLVGSSNPDGTGISGWRGFTLSQGENADSNLLHGRVTLNQFGNIS